MAEVMAEVALRDLYFGEGPRWHDGRLWFSDFYGHCVRALSPDGDAEVMLRLDGQPSGLGWLPDGRLLVVSMLDHLVLRQEATGAISLHADISSVSRHRSNDMLVDPLGGAYVGNFGFDSEAPSPGERVPVPTSLCRVEPDGTVTAAATDLLFPNGMALTPDGRTLIVAETLGARLAAFDVNPDGALSGRRVWADLTGTGVRPDGICLDADGAVWTAAAAQPRCVLVREGGEIVAEAKFSQNCYACALGDADRRTLYALTAPTSASAIARAAPRGLVEKTRVKVPGTGLP
jgi:sugar lactone lactonase YvrE